MQTVKWHHLLFFALAGFLPCLWYAGCLEGGRCLSAQWIGGFLGVAGYCLFALSLLLSSRWRKLEDWMGGLDRLYHFHRRCGELGFCLVLAHPLAYALKWLPAQYERLVLFTLPLHGRLSMNLGALAFWLMVIILGITFLRLLPYDKWKTLHKGMSLVFILASLHFLLSERRLGAAFTQGLLYLPLGIGLFGILYKQLYIPLLVKSARYRVADVVKINDNVVEVVLTPEEKPLCFIPGQYGFFSFASAALTKEAHPFTFIGAPQGDDASVSLLVKARGDYSRNFYARIAKGCSAACEGPYGRFDYAQYGKAQIWIGGGIGIVPFLAWIRSMRGELPVEMEADLYYCVHRKGDAVFNDEFERFAANNPRFRFFLQCTEEHNRLDSGKIAAHTADLPHKTILICGPQKLTRHFQKALVRLGVPRDNIVFEDFEFF